ncbi:uncharacterized protein LOC105180837 [Harpegnathos saltator]|uniref:uncharacterized protein LOC105180837 n=1 Tax=Harpegnathos saltator TaxID=610380 RepID=UPI000DBEE7F7|nr:uncharacterized protein LOC105180837 [Harpegnathos saltator]
MAPVKIEINLVYLVSKVSSVGFQKLSELGRFSPWIAVTSCAIRPDELTRLEETRRNFQRYKISSSRDQRNYFARKRESTRESTNEVEQEDEKRGTSMINFNGAIGILMLLLTLGLEAVTIVNHHPDDEYVLNHEVLREDALAEAKKMELYSDTIHSISLETTDMHLVTLSRAIVASQATAGTDEKGPIPGCKACISSEMTYCSDGRVIEDHCCCEGNTNKVFPFVEHTCRVGPEECKVQAGNCAEYTRLRECCCHSYLASVWKYLATGAGSGADVKHTKFLLILTVLLLLT